MESPRASYQYEALRITSPPDRTSGKKDRIRLFKTLAARCAVSVKSLYADMRDCHSASAALAEVLHYRGFLDARSVGCSVLVADHAGPIGLFGELNITEKPFHSVVVVSGCLIDGTAGQFRSSGLDFPDYLVFDGLHVLQMLNLNRRALGVQGNLPINFFRCGPRALIAYIPTNPSFEVR